ncbi:hypothetical protein TgHK011_003857 [Trichoderma gracile]|nr:hypothetical protein TgHK011_003857 [Trichoderma gracile]
MLCIECNRADNDSRRRRLSDPTWPPAKEVFEALLGCSSPADAAEASLVVLTITSFEARRRSTYFRLAHLLQQHSPASVSLTALDSGTPSPAPNLLRLVLKEKIPSSEGWMDCGG